MTDPNVQTGFGMRGIKDQREYDKYLSGRMYIQCLSCEKKWQVPVDEWNLNPPTICPYDNTRALSSEMLVHDAFPTKWKKNEETGVLEVVVPEEPWERAGVKRYVTADIRDPA